MAYVSSFSSKKLPSFSSHGFSSSSSSRHIYDGVFGSSNGSNKVNSSGLCSFSDDDYGEIFGSSKFDNGSWESSCCSIPVVELPVSEQRVRGVRGLEMDYCGVFGGACDEKLSVPNGEEFFDQLKKKAKISTDTVPSSRSKEQTKEATRSHISSQPQNVQASMNGFTKSIDGVKHHKQKSNAMPSDETNGARPVGHFHDTSGSTCTSHEVAPQEIQSSSTPVIKVDTEIGIDTQIRGKHSRNSSSNLGVEKQKSEQDAGNQRTPVLSELNSAATSLNTHQPTNQTNGASHEVDSSQKAQMSRTPVIKVDTELEMDINPATKGKQSRHSSSEIGVNEHKSEHDAGFRKSPGSSSSNSDATLSTAQPSKFADDAEVAFVVKDNVRVDGFSHFGATKQNSEIHDVSQKASGLSRSSSVAASFDTCQAEVATAFNAGKKQGRHSRMTSLDLGARRQANDHDAVGFQRKSRLGGSYSFDASHDPFVAHIKVQPSKVVPSSSQPHFFSIESHYKVSDNSNSSNSLPSLDDQLDMNSLAAISAAALQRAIEEAEMRIRLAKEFLEREGRGSTKLSFKDTLKVKVMKENKHVNEMNNVRQKKNVVEDHSQVRHLNEMNNVRQKKNVVEDHSQVRHLTEMNNVRQKRNVVEDHSQVRHLNEMNNVRQKKNVVEDRSPFERESVIETAQFVPVLEDHKQFPEESIKGENAKAPKSIEEPQECEKNEAGEWEATKHLNQLITGVKNKIASFMTWQVETEKKEEEPKEVEPIIKLSHVSEYGGCEPLETDKSQHVTICADKMDIEENTMRVCPPDIELEESESNRDNTKEQEKVGNLVDITPDIERPTTTNFLFFTFNSRRSGDRHHPEEAENYESQGSAESGTENRQEELVDEVMNEQIHSNDTKANLEALHDISVSQDCGESLIHSINEELVKKIKECNPMAEHDTCKFIHEEDNEWELNKEPRDDSELSQEAIAPGTKEELAHDCAMDEGHQNVRVMNEEHGIDGIESTHEEGDGRRVKEGSGDDRSALAHEAGNDTKVNEECGDDTDTSIHEEDNDRMVYEEHGDDRSRFADEAENRMLTEEHGEAHIVNSHYPENIVHGIEKDDDEQNEIKVAKEDDEQHDNAQLTEEANLVGAAGKIARATGERYESIENERDKCSIDHIEEVCGQMNGVEEDKGYQSQAKHVEETTKKEAEQASCMTVDDKCWQMEDVVLSKPEEVVCRIDGSNIGAETVFPVEDDEKIMEISDSSLELEVGIETTAPLDEGSEEKMEKTNHSSEPEIGVEHPVLSRNANECIGEERVLTSVLTENAVEFDGIEHLTDVDATFPCENSVSHECETDVNCGQKDVIDGKETELKSEDIFENQAKHLHESGKTVDTGEASFNDQEAEKCNVEAVHRRRRWFENGEKVGAAERPIIHEGGRTNLVVDQDALEESDLAGSVEIHADKLDGETAEVLIREADTVLNQEDSQVNVEATHKRRRWFVNRGEEGVPEPPSFFEGIKVTSEIDHEIVNEPMPQNTSDECVDKASSDSGDTVVFSEADEVASGEKDKQNVEATPRRKRWFESVEKVGPAQNLRSHEDDRMTVEINQEHEVGSDTEKHNKLGNIPTVEENNDVPNKVEPVKESHRDLDAANRRKKEKEKERIAVERAIREARERAFAEARERAKRDAVERPNKATCQKAGSGDQDRQGKVSAETGSSGDKALMEAKLRAERAAVERATAEVRERALQKALSEKASQRSREQSGRHPVERSSSLDPKYNSSSYYRCSDSSNNGEKYDGADGESAQRCKARLERQKRTMERAAKALEEKNMRDLLVQKEQAARNMLAGTLDAEVKRWSSGKEGNVRALLSTLQYILGSDSGWQAVSLTDLVAPTAVRKAYKKATLCVHPDKLQQRGASIQQKYICEKVFDLLKDAWSRFNPDDR